jgi:hypothetical protein
MTNIINKKHKKAINNMKKTVPNIDVQSEILNSPISYNIVI